MTVLVDPAIQQRYDQNAAAQRAAAAGVAGELRARQQEVAERVAANKAALAKIGKQLEEAKKPAEPPPARRPEDNDLSAKAEAYQEADEETPPQPVVQPVARRVDAEEEVASFQWDEDPKPVATPLPQPAGTTPPPKRERPAKPREDEDLSEHDWLE